MSVGIPTDNKLAASETLTIYNVTLTSANTEYPQTLPRNCRKFAVRPRTSTHVIKMASVSGESGSNYISIDSSGYYDDDIGVHKLILYLQSTTAGAVVEITVWN